MSTGHSSPSTAASLTKTIVYLTQASLAKSTLQSYKRSWNQFNAFTLDLQLPSSQTELPLSQHIVALFTAYLYERGFAPNSIRSQLSAISYSHHLQALPNPTESFLVSKMVKGISELFPESDDRYPITLPILHSLIHVIGKIAPSNYERALYSAMFATAFYGFLRCGEMCASPHTLQFAQLSLDSVGHKHFNLKFDKFKHSKPGKPFFIQINSKQDSPYCPVTILLSYMRYRGSFPGPLFCYMDGSPVSRARFTKQLQLCLNIMKLPTAHYKSHSFRIGAATSALLQGKSESEIQLLGRWSSSAFKKYMRLASINSI